ncbi:efflux RND transporter periplasmic adaptor subunit [Pseudoxanthobacter sp.]|uniref:efflux RND transporter periplasmic adaptor subunit n=1 Tax=Pseudoxanthobacter sp. TaxID=1925742 RepID=UPI002FE1EAC1
MTQSTWCDENGRGSGHRACSASAAAPRAAGASRNWLRGLAAGMLAGLGLGAAFSAPALAADKPAAAAPAPSVIAVPIVNEDVTDERDFVGNVEAIQQVDLKARVQGFLDQVAFTEGAFVGTGQLLYQIEQAPFQAALAQAQGQLAAANAQLASTKANVEQKQLTLDRQLALVKSGTVSQAIVDTATADRDIAAASVQQAQASIQEAQANVEEAQLNLSYTTMAAPIAGRIGKTNYTVGNLVNEASGTLATLVQMDPIRVVFAVPEKAYVLIMRDAAKGKSAAAAEQATEAAATGGVSDQLIPTLRLPDGTKYSHPGKIEFISNVVNQNTGTVAVRAEFTNPDSFLLPGQYVTVSVQIGDKRQMPVVPQSAVLQGPQGAYVFVIDTENRAVQRAITFDGATIVPSGGYAITSGLVVGDVVITDGLQKVRPGMVVAPTVVTPAQASNPLDVADPGATGAATDAGKADGKSGGDKTGAATTQNAAPAAGK